MIQISDLIMIIKWIQILSKSWKRNGEVYNAQRPVTRSFDVFFESWCTLLFAHFVDYIVVMEAKTQPSGDVHQATDWMGKYNHCRHTTTDKYNNNGKCWCFRFHHDGSIIQYMGRCVFSISISLVMIKRIYTFLLSSSHRKYELLSNV